MKAKRLIDDADRERIGHMNAEAWRQREVEARKLGIEDELRKPRPEPQRKSVMSLLLDPE